MRHDLQMLPTSTRLPHGCNAERAQLPVLWCPFDSANQAVRLASVGNAGPVPPGGARLDSGRTRRGHSARIGEAHGLGNGWPGARYGVRAPYDYETCLSLAEVRHGLENGLIFDLTE